MRPFLAAIAGFFASAVVFTTGALVAMNLFMNDSARDLADRENVAAVWSPTPVDTDTGMEPRVVAPSLEDGNPDGQREAKTTLVASLGGMEATANIDVTETAGIDVSDTSDPIEMSEQAIQAPRAHIEWCLDNYRSYDPATNTYTPYSGGTEPCVSPYSEIAMNTPQAEVEQVAMTDSFELSEEHILECMNRYRSYRLEDNSYLPYVGGPRRQCTTD